MVALLVSIWGAETLRAQETDHPRKLLLEARTNLLLPALNVGAELPLGNSWSIGADWYYPWLFRNADHRNCVQALALNLEGRYWFGRGRTPERRLLGHSIGLFTMAGYYDFERNYKGLQGEFATVGVDYLYALPVFKKKMRLELSLGVGYFYSQARQYEVYIRYFGPVKANVALVLPIYSKKK